jgi:hypothetical protein
MFFWLMFWLRFELQRRGLSGRPSYSVSPFPSLVAAPVSDHTGPLDKARSLRCGKSADLTGFGGG